MGLPIERLVIATNVNDILVRTLAVRPLRAARRSWRPRRRRWIFRYRRISSGCCSTRTAATRAAIAQAHGGARREEAASRSRETALGGFAQIFEAGRADEDETRATIRDVHRSRAVICSIRTARSVSRWRASSRSKRPFAVVVLGTAHPAKFPEAVEQATGMRPPCPRGSPILAGARAVRSPARRSGDDRQIRDRTFPRRGRGRSMSASARVTKLDSGITVVTDNDAASGDRLARHLGRRRLPPRGGERERRFPSSRAHGLQGNRAPQRPPDRRGNRGRRRRPQRVDGLRGDGLLTRACSATTCRSRSTSSPTFSPRRPSIPTNSRASRT